MDQAVVRHRVLLASAVVVGVAALGLVAAAVLWPEAAKWAGQTPLYGKHASETPMDWLSVPPYVAALALCLVMVVRTWDRRPRRPLWVLLAFVLAWLLWRELPWDGRLLNDANTFSWAKYVGSPDVPVWAQVVLGGGSMVVALLLVVYVVRHARDVGRLLAEKVRSASGWVFAMGAVLLAAAQAMDKYGTVDRHLGTDLAAWKAGGWLGYVEESLEFLGPVLLLAACVVAVLEEPARPAVPRIADAAKGTEGQGEGGEGGGSSSSRS
ncbi:MAG: hypothetical protein R6X20_07935 [Phycisphaerae bacterium]